MFGFRSAPPAHVTTWMVVEHTDAGAALSRTAPPDIAARAKMRSLPSKRILPPLLRSRSESMAMSIEFTGAR
jgi:hypothetical protein